MISWGFIGLGREALIGSKAKPTFALYGNIHEGGPKEIDMIIGRHTQWKLRWMQPHFLEESQKW
jgi:hypothetical protein